MKLRLTSPTFTAAAKTVTHASFSDITLAGIQLIVNVTDQIIIYNFADSTKGGTLSTDTLTLEYDTTSMSDTDELMILVDDGATTTAVSGTVAVTNAGITTIAGAVSGTEMQVDVLTMPTVAVTGTFYQATQPVSGTVAVTNAGITTIAGAVAGTEMQVDVLTSALPTGASTSAKQDTVIGHLDGVEGLLTTIDGDTGSIDAKTPALGQALAAASVPVVLPAAQITTLTPPAAITGFATSAKQDTLISHVDGIETLLSGTLTVTGGGGGTEYTEDVATANPIVGTATMIERDDVLSTVTPIEGDNIGLRGTAEGALWTQDFNSDAILADTTATKNALETAGGLVVNLGANNDVTVTGNVAVTNAGITTIAGAIAGTEMQVDVLTMPTVTVNAHAVTNAGTFAVQAAEADGANVTLGAKADAKSTATDTTAISAMSVLKQISASVQAPPSQVVTATDLDIRNLTNTDVVTAELSAVDNAVLDTIAAKDFATQTTLSAINAKMVTGTDIGDVTINNASGASAVNIQDGGNSITVDGSLTVDLGANNDVTVTSGTVTANLGATDNAVLDQLELNQDAQTAILTTIDADTGAIKTALETAGGLVVNLGANNDVTVTGSVTADLGANNDVTITSGTITAVTAITNALPAGTNAIGKLAANSGVDIGDVDVTSISAGTNLVGDVGIQPRTTNGLDTFMASGSDGSSILVATSQAVKASAGKVYGYYLYNPEAAVTFVHFYNTASASVTVGTTNPLFTLAIPAGSGANLMNDIGITFGTAISMSATTTAGGNTAPATGVSAVVWYK